MKDEGTAPEHWSFILPPSSFILDVLCVSVPLWLIARGTRVRSRIVSLHMRLFSSPSKAPHPLTPDFSRGLGRASWPLYPRLRGLLQRGLKPLALLVTVVNDGNGLPIPLHPRLKPGVSGTATYFSDTHSATPRVSSPRTDDRVSRALSRR